MEVTTTENVEILDNDEGYYIGIEFSEPSVSKRAEQSSKPKNKVFKPKKKSSKTTNKKKKPKYPHLMFVIKLMLHLICLV